LFCSADERVGGPRVVSRAAQVDHTMPIETGYSSRVLDAPEQHGPVVRPDSGLSRFIAEDGATRKLLQQVEIVAPHLRLTAIEGEPGVGKQTLARHLFRRATAANSYLQRAGFFRCDARDWLLSETDPQAMAGFFYLDRVDLLAGPGQALLLRTLKKLEIWPSASFAIVASSEASFRELATKGQFLPELAYRLTAIRFAIPPLRERRSDIVPLAKFFLEHICRRYRLQPVVIASDAIEQMLAYAWPGNVRALAGVLESAVVGCTGSVIRSEDLALPAVPSTMNTSHPAKVLTLDEAIQNHVRYVLELNRGNKLRAARQLGISRSTLYRMLEPGHAFAGEAAL
jgi:DNA-binding NtrC family response regulator